MKTYWEQLIDLKKDSIAELTDLLEQYTVITLLNCDIPNWTELEEFYDLPQELMFTDPFYDNYYLHKAYIEDGTITIQGFNLEHEEHYDFTIEEIRGDEILFLVDKIKSIIN